jgi:hypothetical protein
VETAVEDLTTVITEMHRTATYVVVIMTKATARPTTRIVTPVGSEDTLESPHNCWAIIKDSIIGNLTRGCYKYFLDLRI